MSNIPAARICLSFFLSTLLGRTLRSRVGFPLYRIPTLFFTCSSSGCKLTTHKEGTLDIAIASRCVACALADMIDCLLYPKQIFAAR